MLFFKLGENSCSRQFSKPCYGANVNERRNTVFEEQYFGIHNKSYLSTRYELFIKQSYHLLVFELILTDIIESS